MKKNNLKLESKIKAVFYFSGFNENKHEFETEANAYCKLKGYKLYKVYIDNSSDVLNFNLMYSDLEKGKFNKIILNNCFMLPVKNTKGLIEFLKVLRNYNCDFEVLKNEQKSTIETFKSLIIKGVI